MLTNSQINTPSNLNKVTKNHGLQRQRIICYIMSHLEIPSREDAFSLVANFNIFLLKKDQFIYLDADGRKLGQRQKRVATCFSPIHLKVYNNQTKFCNFQTFQFDNFNDSPANRKARLFVLDFTCKIYIFEATRSEIRLNELSIAVIHKF